MLALFLLFVGSVASTGYTMNIVQFNWLNDIWMGATKPNGQYKYYVGVDPFLYFKDRRGIPEVQLIMARQNSTDVFVFEEVAVREYYMQFRLLDNFNCGWCSHNASYWINDVKGNHTWEPNGNVICLKKSTFNHIAHTDMPLWTDGNHAVFSTATHAASGKTMRFFGVHFDDTEKNWREKESAYAADYLDAGRNQNIDFIIGDMNTGVNSTATGLARPVFTYFFSKGFVDAGYTFGSKEATHPWNAYTNASAPYFDYTSYDGPIDHITIRGGTFTVYDVFNYDILSNSDETERIGDTAQRLGTDHFLVSATAHFTA